MAALGAEYASFRGAFDHRRGPPASGAERWATSIAALGAQRSPGSLVHVGHSTHLLVIDGVRLLTDPWFYDPAFGALAHDPAPAVRPDALGPLDAILVSHDHADHADLRAMDEMDKRAHVVVATNDLAARVKARGFREVTVLAPWEELRVRSVTVAAVPAVHDVYEVGFVARSQATSVYFAGDTRLHDDLPAIAERHAPKVAILPVDGTRLTGGALHVMTPDDAVMAARILGSRLVVPSHAEAIFTDPIAEHLLASAEPAAKPRFAEGVRTELPGTRCVVPAPGERVEF